MRRIVMKKQRKGAKKVCSLASAALTGVMAATGVYAQEVHSQEVHSQEAHSQEAVQLREPETLQQEQYPDFSTAFSTETYDIWLEQNQNCLQQAEGLAEELKDFSVNSIRTFLTSSESETENIVYSPVNVWTALALLTECTGGDTRAELLDVLGAEDIIELRRMAERLYGAVNYDDGHTTRISGNSVWLEKRLSYNPETLDLLAEQYHAASYQGTMGSDALNQLLQNWLKEQTGGLLEEQAGNEELDPDTVLALASTLYYRARWENTFSSGLTEKEEFYGTEETIVCDFMHASRQMQYYQGEQFAAVSLNMDDRQGGKMWIVLPEEDASVEEVLAGEEYYQLILGELESTETVLVDLSLPKFDVSSDLELRSGLKQLGISLAFDAAHSDYTAILPGEEELELSAVKHAARVKIDEEGCEAAAYTVEMIAKSAAPPAERVEFVVNRPFLFAVSGPQALPLFTGAVYCPVE